MQNPIALLCIFGGGASTLFLSLLYVRKGSVSPGRLAVYRSGPLPPRFCLAGGLLLSSICAIALSLIIQFFFFGSYSYDLTAVRAIQGFTRSTANIKFCEPDFWLSTWIAEPCNVITAMISYVMLGFFGIFIMDRNSSVGRDATVVYTIMVIMGIGSSGFHATMLAATQPLDELGMLYLVAAMVFLVSTKSDINRALHVIKLVTWCIICTLIYYAYREMFTVFLAEFLVSVITLTVMCFKLGFKREVGNLENQKFQYSNPFLRESQKHGRSPSMGSLEEVRLALIRPLMLNAVILFILGTLHWLSEMAFCEEVSASYASSGWAPLLFMWWNVLHPMWHIFTGLGTHLMIQAIVARRVICPQHMPSLTWWGIPFVDFAKQKDGGIVKKMN